MRKITVLIVDDHPLLISGLTRVLNSMSFVEKVFSSTDGADAINICSVHTIDIVFMDYSMPALNGYELSILLLRRFRKNLKIIVLSAYVSRPIVESFLKIGVKGFLTKTENLESIEHAIKAVSCGDLYFCDNVLNKIDINISGLSNDPLPLSFTKREIDILKLIVHGFTNCQVAEHLKLSQRTVETYRFKLISKVHGKNTAELIQYVYLNKILNE